MGTHDCTTGTTRAVLYARVSTQEQAIEGYGLGAQLEALRGMAEAKGWSCTEITDEGISGSTTDRPGLQQALAMLNRGEADCIAVAKLDRLSRSVHDFTGLLATSRAEGWDFIALDLGVDTTTAAGELVAVVLAAVAEWERRTIGERTKVGLAEAKARGVKLGRPRAYGPEVVALVAELRAQNLSYRAIATELGARGYPTARGGPWSPSSVQAIAERP
jgi:DNA invertase Pin-like site-specific DNA recombinase